MHPGKTNPCLTSMSVKRMHDGRPEAEAGVGQEAGLRLKSGAGQEACLRQKSAARQASGTWQASGTGGFSVELTCTWHAGTAWMSANRKWWRPQQNGIHLDAEALGKDWASSETLSSGSVAFSDGLAIGKASRSHVTTPRLPDHSLIRSGQALGGQLQGIAPPSLARSGFSRPMNNIHLLLGLLSVPGKDSWQFCRSP